jgi:hypothetical membrane protein
MHIKLNIDRISRHLLLCGIFAPVTMMVIIIVVGQITPHYSPVSDTISQMGTPESPYASVLNCGFVIYSVLIGLTAYGFHRRLRYAAMGKTLVILLGIHAVGIILLMVFPDSPEFVGKHFTDDILHNVFSAVAYPALLVGILVFTGIARQEKALRITAVVGLAVVFFNLPMPFINMIDSLRPISGLLQRLLMASSFSWLALTSLFLYRNNQNDRSNCRFGNEWPC